MSPSSPASPPSFTLEDEVHFLMCPGSYPDRPARVGAVETHMAWVFLAGGFAYKLKKPVRLDFLDFSTLEARRRDCILEVQLNRRLAPEVYLGVIPLTHNQLGQLGLHGEGEVVDWLVHMRRLPRERMLDYAIEHHTVGEGNLQRVAAVLAAFYRAAPRPELSPAAYRRRFEQGVRENLHKLVTPAFELPLDLLKRIATALLLFVKREAALFDRRVEEGRIVEGHGDLRPEHVCLTSPPVIFDCLEFNRAFRILDVADELAFLAMECERLGAPFVGRVLFETHRARTGDDPPASLLHFYKSYRALLRAKLTILHLRDADAREHPRWRRRTLDYLRQAEGYLLSRV